MHQVQADPVPTTTGAVGTAMRRAGVAIALLRPRLQCPCPGCAARTWAISDDNGALRLSCRGCGWSAYHVDDCADGAAEPSVPLRGGAAPWPSSAGTRRPI